MIRHAWLNNQITEVHAALRCTYGTIVMKNALAKSMSELPEQLHRSLTWNQGWELSAQAEFDVETDIRMFFAVPRSPWQRGTNESTKGLLRHYFPKGSDLSVWPGEDIEVVPHALNTRPRMTLGWNTPAEAFDEHLGSLQQGRCYYDRFNLVSTCRCTTRKGLLTTTSSSRSAKRRQIRQRARGELQRPLQVGTDPSEGSVAQFDEVEFAAHTYVE